MISFDIVMAKEFKVGREVFEKLAGVYKMNDDSVMEFYRQSDFLFMKWNSQVWEGLSYKGNNTFSGGAADSTLANFQILENGEVKVKLHLKSIIKGEVDLEGIRVFNY